MSTVNPLKSFVLELLKLEAEKVGLNYDDLSDKRKADFYSGVWTGVTLLSVDVFLGEDVQKSTEKIIRHYEKFNIKPEVDE